MPNTFSIWDHSIETLEKAIHIRKQIEALKASLVSLYGDGAQPFAKETPSPVATIAKRRGRPPKVQSTPFSAPVKIDGRKAKRSPATIAKMRAAAKARWAKAKK